MRTDLAKPDESPNLGGDDRTFRWKRIGADFQRHANLLHDFEFQLPPTLGENYVAVYHASFGIHECKHASTTAKRPVCN